MRWQYIDGLVQDWSYHSIALSRRHVRGNVRNYKTGHCHAEYNVPALCASSYFEDLSHDTFAERTVPVRYLFRYHTVTIRLMHFTHHRNATQGLMIAYFGNTCVGSSYSMAHFLWLCHYQDCWCLFNTNKARVFHFSDRKKHLSYNKYHAIPCWRPVFWAYLVCVFHHDCCTNTWVRKAY